MRRAKRNTSVHVVLDRSASRSRAGRLRARRRCARLRRTARRPPARRAAALSARARAPSRSRPAAACRRQFATRARCRRQRGRAREQALGLLDQRAATRRRRASMRAPSPHARPRASAMFSSTGQPAEQRVDLESARQAALDARGCGAARSRPRRSRQNLAGVGRAARPVSMLTNVVLPAPLGPISAWRAPRARAKSTSASPSSAPKRFLQSLRSFERRRGHCAFSGDARQRAAIPASPSGAKQHDDDQQHADRRGTSIRVIAWRARSLRDA